MQTCWSGVSDTSLHGVYLYQLDLLTDSRQDILFKPVELIKASPGSTFDKSHEDAAHTFEVKVTITVED